MTTTTDDTDLYSERLLDRLAEKVATDDNGCLIWIGTIERNGYGSLWVRGRTSVAHRIVYAALVGAIPGDLELDHLCKVRPCCHPDHLEPVTRRENILRSESPSAHNARKTHCKNGHEFTPENTYLYPPLSDTSMPRRTCRACRAEGRLRSRSRIAVAS